MDTQGERQTKKLTNGEMKKWRDGQMKRQTHKKMGSKTIIIIF